MNEETAVEWLFKEIYGDTGYIYSYTANRNDAFTALKTAKRIFREQIEAAYNAGLQIDGYRPDCPTGDIYYDVKYKKR